jgi:protein involved in polysaccharide export with SLBB domain
MENRMLFPNMLLLTFILLLGNLYISLAQQPDLSQIDFRNIRVDELHDSQIRQLKERAESEGYTTRDVEAEALARGLPYSEAEKLRARFDALEKESDGPARGDVRPAIQRDTPVRRVAEDAQLSAREVDAAGPGEETEVFGYYLFKRDNLSFEPSLNIPTPQNYLIGPGDELVVEVWGAAQQSYRLGVSPEGQVNISNIGPVMVSGLTVEKASELIISRLGAVYSGLRGPNPNIWAQVTLGNVRSIKVTLAGDIYLPGTYTLPSFTTAFNALYMAGGPSEKGSFRDIRVIRQGGTIANIDLYDFLIRGEISLNIRLQDEDLIFVGPSQKQATITGNVRRPATYEMMGNETLEDLIVFCGGFSSNAYFKRLQVDRKTDSQRKLLNVESELFSSFLMQDGDQINVERILERYENRVTIRGAVFREGKYGLTEGMTLKELITKAEGLREDAFLNRGVIYRIEDNLHIETIDFNIESILKGTESDILLKREDLVMISSVTDLQQERTVTIAGEVKLPDIYAYARNITLGELIRQAGGLNESASLSRVEIARRVVNRTAVSPANQITEIFTFPLDGGLSLRDTASSFMLEPYDMVFVRRSPGYENQLIVEVYGEVNFPGNYAITRKSERISDLINRAGGLTDAAYVPGATLVRQVRSTQIEKIDDYTFIDNPDQRNFREIVEARDQTIGINLERIMNNPYGADDLIILEGDILSIPQELQTVRLNGALLYPVTTRYQRNKGLRGYVSQAGGFASNAQKKNVYVIYANGSVDKTRNYLLFMSYPAVEPGAEIIVPQKPPRRIRSAQEAMAITSSVTSLLLIIVTLMNQL